MDELNPQFVKVVIPEIKAHQLIWERQGPRIATIATVLNGTKFGSTSTSLLFEAQAGHEAVKAMMIKRCAEGAEIWSMIDQLLQVAVLRYSHAMSEAAAQVHKLEQRLPR
jgi:hypothetical protein